MKHITFYLDFVSPYAWLAFQALPKALEGISHRLHYHPVVFGAMLKHHGQLGPAEMPGKRDWTYRQVMWLAKQQGTDLQMPASHPFNSLSLLRLAVAASDNGEPNRYVVESIFKYVWCTGLEASDAERLEALQLHFKPYGIQFLGNLPKGYLSEKNFRNRKQLLLSKTKGRILTVDLQPENNRNNIERSSLNQTT